MNPVLWEIVFGKKGSLFSFGRGTKLGTFDGMRGYKTYKDEFIIKDPETKQYKVIQRIWNDEDFIQD